MTRNCDLGLFPRLIEQWRLEEEAKEAKEAKEAEEARRIQLASRPKFDSDKTREESFVDLLTTWAALTCLFLDYALFIICFG